MAKRPASRNNRRDGRANAPAGGGPQQGDAEESTPDVDELVEALEPRRPALLPDAPSSKPETESVAEPPAKEDVELVADEEPEAQPQADSGPVHLWMLAAAFLTAIVMLIVITLTGAWNPFACENNDDCRGGRQCYASQCEYPEVWLRGHPGEGTGAP